MLLLESLWSKSPIMASKKILLITLTPPGDGSVGEIILRDMVECMPEIAFDCVAICPAREIKGFVRKSSEKIEIDESIYRIRTASKFQSCVKLFEVMRRLEGDIESLVDVIAETYHNNNYDELLVVLNSPMIMAISSLLVSKYALPYRALIWDDPEYLLFQYAYNAWSRRRVIKSLEKTLANAKQVAVVSEEMVQEYRNRFGAKCSIVRHGVPVTHEGVSLERKQTITIGIAGGIYAVSAWESLLLAFDRVNWMLGKRNLELLVLGSDCHIKSKAHANVRYMGFRGSPDLESILSECDLLYVPQPFEPPLKRLSSLSFPTKLSTYLALGKPVFAHGPQYATLNAFFQKHECGVFCDSLEPEVIIQSLHQLMQPEHYERYAANAKGVHEALFSKARFKSDFRAFLGLDA